MATKSESIPNGTVTSPRGFLAGSVNANINKGSRDKLDLGLLFSVLPCVTVGLFTTNVMKAAPVLLCQQKVPSNSIRAVVVNSGYANAGTGRNGLKDAIAIVKTVSDIINVKPKDILITSTGIIGRRLPTDSINGALKKIKLSPDGGHSLAEAIMTTDTTTKEIAIKSNEGNYIIGGIAKGSGMVHPQLGTLLCFLTTDARVDSAFLATALKKAVDASFNMVSIDGDTSPNDTVLLMANGLADNKLIERNTTQATIFQEQLDHICIHLAKAIARDGEGANKLIEVKIIGAANKEDARSAAKAIVSSSLVKTAIHGNNPNWGRIIAAVGRSGAKLDESKLSLSICGLCIIKEGIPLPFDNNYIADALKGNEVSIELNLQLGVEIATAWGCDLSEEYVTINSLYTT
jgi:glutamate N-acetyltransferase/amino-acid N-acetyltransferase